MVKSRVSSEDASATSVVGQAVFDKRDLLVALVLCVGVFCVYLRTMAPGLLLTDSGEFQTLAAKGGLAHGPGYAVYLFLIKLINLLPFGTTAYKANLASGIFGVVGVGAMYFLGRAFGTRKPYAAIGAFGLAFHWLYWWQANVAEVYTISTATLLLILLFAVLWKRTRSSRYLLYGGLLGGLSIGLHATILICAPVVLIYLIINNAKKDDWKTTVAAIATGLCVAFLGFMILGSYDGPTTATNSVSYSAGAYGMKKDDFDSPFTRVTYTLTLKQFRSTLTESTPNIRERNDSLFVSWLLDSVGVIFAVCSVLGFIWIFWRKPRWLYVGWREGFLLTACFAILAGFALGYAAHDVEVFFIPAHAILLAALACGFQGIEAFLRSFRMRTDSQRAATENWPFVVTAAIAIVGIIPIATQIVSCVSSGKLEFLSGYARKVPYPVDNPDSVHEQAAAFAGAVEDNALILNDWLMVYPIMYVTSVEQNRPNVEAIELTPAGSIGHADPSLKEQLRVLYLKRPIYTPGPARSLMDEWDFYQVPAPVPVYRLARKGERPPLFAQDGTLLRGPSPAAASSTMRSPQ